MYVRNCKGRVQLCDSCRFSDGQAFNFALKVFALCVFKMGQMIKSTIHVLKKHEIKTFEQIQCNTHTGKYIRRFGGIYAYCWYFIDRK